MAPTSAPKHNLVSPHVPRAASDPDGCSDSEQSTQHAAHEHQSGSLPAGARHCGSGPRVILLHLPPSPSLPSGHLVSLSLPPFLPLVGGCGLSENMPHATDGLSLSVCLFLRWWADSHAFNALWKRLIFSAKLHTFRLVGFIFDSRFSVSFLCWLLAPADFVALGTSQGFSLSQ